MGSRKEVVLIGVSHTQLDDRYPILWGIHSDAGGSIGVVLDTVVGVVQRFQGDDQNCCAVPPDGLRRFVVVAVITVSVPAKYCPHGR